MRLAVLDVGSNTVNLLVTDSDTAVPLRVRAWKSRVSLSETLERDGAVGATGRRRMIAAVRKAADEARRLKVDALFPYATAVVRDAPNREQILGEVANAAGISSPAVSWPVVTGRAVTGAPALRKGPFVSRERRKALRPWIARLAAMPARERAGHPGVSAHRARHILAGSVVAYELMHRLDLDVLSICPWALREGLLLRQLERYQPVLGNAVWIPWRAPGQPQTDSRAGGSDKIAALTPQPRVVDLAAVSALV